MQFCRILWLQGHLSPLRQSFFIVGTSTNKCVLSDATNSNTHNSNSNSSNSNSSNSNSEAKADENTENELGLLEFIHTLVETMDKWAGSICELDIMYQLEQVHFLVDKMVMDGCIVETNKSSILRPIDLIERESKKDEGMFGGR